VVGSSATLDVNSAFFANILASSTITFDTGATDLCGRALAENGAVSFAGQGSEFIDSEPGLHGLRDNRWIDSRKGVRDSWSACFRNDEAASSPDRSSAHQSEEPSTKGRHNPFEISHFIMEGRTLRNIAPSTWSLPNASTNTQETSGRVNRRQDIGQVVERVSCGRKVICGELPRSNGSIDLRYGSCNVIDK
jgi:hypothetical protein